MLEQLTNGHSMPGRRGEGDILLDGIVELYLAVLNELQDCDGRVGFGHLPDLEKSAGGAEKLASSVGVPVAGDSRDVWGLYDGHRDAGDFVLAHVLDDHLVDGFSLEKKIGVSAFSRRSSEITNAADAAMSQTRPDFFIWKASQTNNTDAQ